MLPLWDAKSASRIDEMTPLPYCNDPNKAAPEPAILGSFTKTNNANAVIVAIAVADFKRKSRLDFALLNEKKAIVSKIPGTTRDVIEDVITIKGVTFRFIDTAGLRHTVEPIETIGIERSYEKNEPGGVVLYVFDITTASALEIDEAIADIRIQLNDPVKQIIPVANKT